MSSHRPPSNFRTRWSRALWLLAGALCLLIGVIGIVVPLLPTTPLVLLAAFCFSRGSERWERWLLAHRHFGPMVRDWRAHRAVPLRAKQLATAMMAVSSIGTWFVVASPWRWAPGVCCLAVALWLWSLPTAAPRRSESPTPK
ncbi:MAG TPA: YbaN family protein [Rhizobacter sp.]|nr:YbaN family protein [Rhizobacter sp.]